ncbi:Uncharacterised protein [Chlamydia trachomatis]|nr:Uncharacterised protein [Chlamydia trachomatis]
MRFNICSGTFFVILFLINTNNELYGKTAINCAKAYTQKLFNNMTGNESNNSILVF